MRFFVGYSLFSCSFKNWKMKRSSFWFVWSCPVLIDATSSFKKLHLFYTSCSASVLKLKISLTSFWWDLLLWTTEQIFAFFVVFSYFCLKALKVGCFLQIFRKMGCSFLQCSSGSLDESELYLFFKMTALFNAFWIAIAALCASSIQLIAFFSFGTASCTWKL